MKDNKVLVYIELMKGKPDYNLYKEASEKRGVDQGYLRCKNDVYSHQYASSSEVSAECQ